MSAPALAGARRSLLLSLVLLVARCLPSDPAAPIGVAIDEAASSPRDVVVYYMRCDDEEIEEIVLEVAPEGAGDGGGSTWRLRNVEGELEAPPDGDRLARVEVTDEQDRFELVEPEQVEDWTGQILDVEVRSNLFHDAWGFAVDDLRPGDVHSPDGRLTEDEFRDRYACEDHRT